MRACSAAIQPVQCFLAKPMRQDPIQPLSNGVGCGLAVLLVLRRSPCACLLVCRFARFNQKRHYPSFVSLALSVRGCNAPLKNPILAVAVPAQAVCASRLPFPPCLRLLACLRMACLTCHQAVVTTALIPCGDVVFQSRPSKDTSYPSCVLICPRPEDIFCFDLREARN